MEKKTDNRVPQEGLIKAINVQDGSITGDGVKDKAEISKFEDMTSYNWIKTSVRTSSLMYEWGEYGAPLSTSGSTSVIALPQEQPGKPRQWSPPDSGYVKLSLSPKTSYRDYEHSRGLKHAMDDGVRCITTADGGFISSDIDIFTSDHTFTRLIRFVQGDATPFSLLVHRIEGTLFLIEKGKEAKTDLDLGRSFQSAYTKWSGGLEESTSHQRFVQFNLNGLRCLVRYEADGCLSETDRLMAAALTSDLVHAGSSVQLPPPALQMNLHKSTLDLASAFCSEPSKPPEVVSESIATTEAPTSEYHWSQAEVLAEEDGGKQRELGEEKAMEALMADRRNPKRQWRQRSHQSPPKPPRHVSTKQSATSPVVQHNRYLQRYPLLRFHDITKARLMVALEYLNMAGGEFQRALWLYYNPQGHNAEAPSEDSESLLHSLIAATKVTSKEAKRYLVHCSDDYDKALRLHTTKLEYFNNKRLRGDDGEVSEDEAKYLRTFKLREKDREVEARRLQVARQREKDKMVPHSALFTLHCSPEKSASTPVKLSNDEFIRLWTTRIPSVITAYVDTQATVTSITYTDIRSRVRDWETDNQDVLAKFSALLKDIKQTVEGSEKSKVILHINDKHKMEIREAGKEEKDVLSQYTTDVWLSHARVEETLEDADIDDDDDQHTINAVMTNNTDDQEEEEESEEEAEEEKEYASDESSVWEREDEDSDDGKEKSKEKMK